MFRNIFTGIFDSELVQTISPINFLLCVGVALLVGLFQAWMYSRQSHSSKSFVTTLAILPVMVTVVIMLVNGNVGTGVAVAGSFSLVRFRSAPGSAKEIGAIFLAMATGLMIGMGYLAYAALFSIFISVIITVYSHLNFGSNLAQREKAFSITIPEDLNYTTVFDDLFEKYTQSHSLISVKTTNMGSLFKLTYHICLKDASQEKEFIDQLRIRNGNLEIAVSPIQALSTEL